MRQKILNKYKYLIVLLLVSFPASLPLIRPGMYEPHDLHHLADIWQMFRAFETGQVPPRLGPDFTWGFGYPLFNFYYHLPFYLGALFYAFFGSLILAFKLVFFISILLSVFGMYVLARLYLNKLPSLLAALLFLYTPYRAVQIYVRGAMGEALALAILPFVIWGFVKLIRDTKLKNLALSALIFALFLLSHNYFWVLSAPIIGVFIIYELYNSNNKTLTTIYQLLATALGLGLSAYFWLPALLEQNLVAEKTPFLLADHFPFVKQLIIPSWGYGSSVWGPGDEISFQIGLINLAFAFFTSLVLLMKLPKLKKYDNPSEALIAIRAKGGKNNILILLSLLFAVFLASIFFMNIRSLPIWKLVPFYDFIQFPWRLLFIAGFVTSFMAGILLNFLKQQFVPAVIIIFITISLTLSYFQPSQIFYKSDEDYLKRFFKTETYSEDYLLLPKWTDKRPETPFESKAKIINGQIFETKKVSDIHYEFEVFAEKDSEFTFWAYYFPGWEAKLNTEELELKPGEPYGQITADLPPGQHYIEIYWTETSLRLVANLISLFSFGLVGYLLWFGYKN